MNKFRFWAGTKHSLDRFMMWLQNFDAAQLQTVAKVAKEAKPKSFQVIGNIAVIPIKGTLINYDAWWVEFFGFASYARIQRQMAEALEDENISRIVLHIDSPGGEVTGIDDTADMIRQVNAQKPVIAYSNGMMASAAYWLGSVAEKIYISQTAEVGSIGVWTMHSDYTKFFEDQGIKNTVIRDGEHKALGLPYEELSEEAREIWQAQIKQLREIFAEEVAKARNLPVDAIIETKSETFIGEKAVTNGFADGITTFNNLIATITKEVFSDMELKDALAEIERMKGDLSAAVDLAKKRDARITQLEEENAKLNDTIVKLQEDQKRQGYISRIEATNLTPARKAKAKEIVGKMVSDEAIEALLLEWEAEPKNALLGESEIEEEDKNPDKNLSDSEFYQKFGKEIK